MPSSTARAAGPAWALPAGCDLGRLALPLHAPAVSLCSGQPDQWDASVGSSIHCRARDGPSRPATVQRLGTASHGRGDGCFGLWHHTAILQDRAVQREQEDARAPWLSSPGPFSHPIGYYHGLPFPLNLPSQLSHRGNRGTIVR